MRPLFQVGKDGLSQAWLDQINEAIEKRELFKINLLQNTMVDEDEVIKFIENNSRVTVVQKIGHVLVLYKQADNKDNRDISWKVRDLAK